MSESTEHAFLSSTFLEVVQTFSRTGLYGVQECERRRFDFECVFKRDWNRPLVGQTLWRHREGIDKDVRSLVTNEDAHIWAYIVPDTVKYRALLHEVVRDFRATRYADQLFKLKVLWVPPTFDADSEIDREVVAKTVESAVVTDILFNVVFGNLNASDVRFFLSITGRIGLPLAVLHVIATEGFTNYPELSHRLGVSAGPLRERILALVGTGLLWQIANGSQYAVSLKGRVFLELLDRIVIENRASIRWSQEVLHILDILELEHSAVFDLGEGLRRRGVDALLWQIAAAVTEWSVDLSRRDYKLHDGENDPRFHWITR